MGARSWCRRRGRCPQRRGVSTSGSCAQSLTLPTSSPVVALFTRSLAGCYPIPVREKRCRKSWKSAGIFTLKPFARGRAWSLPPHPELSSPDGALFNPRSSVHTTSWVTREKSPPYPQEVGRRETCPNLSGPLWNRQSGLMVVNTRHKSATICRGCFPAHGRLCCFVSARPPTVTGHDDLRRGWTSHVRPAPVS